MSENEFVGFTWRDFDQDCVLAFLERLSRARPDSGRQATVIALLALDDAQTLFSILAGTLLPALTRAYWVTLESPAEQDRAIDEATNRIVSDMPLYGCDRAIDPGVAHAFVVEMVAVLHTYRGHRDQCSPDLDFLTESAYLVGEKAHAVGSDEQHISTFVEYGLRALGLPRLRRDYQSVFHRRGRPTNPNLALMLDLSDESIKHLLDGSITPVEATAVQRATGHQLLGIYRARQRLGLCTQRARLNAAIDGRPHVMSSPELEVALERLEDKFLASLSDASKERSA